VPLQPAASAPSKRSCKARFLQRENHSGNSKLAAARCARGRACWGERREALRSVPGVSRTASGLAALGAPAAVDAGEDWGAFPPPCLLPRAQPARLHPGAPPGLPLGIAAATLLNTGPEAESSDIQRLGHPLFNAISDAATCIYIYI